MDGQDRLPSGYRQAITTAITVFLGFSLTLLRAAWGFEERGGWRGIEVASEIAMAVGILFQISALFRALHIRDDNRNVYMKTVRIFELGICAVVIGVIVSIISRR
jgi:hypothetical protein